VEQLADEIFNILKGANYKLRLFTRDGTKTLDSDEATRFYAYDQDLMVSINQEEGKIEVTVQGGVDYDFPGNSEIIKTLRTAVHNKRGEFTVRKLGKKIAPKDFAHQNVQESMKAFGKGFGSVKSSKIPAPNGTTIRIKHNQKVDEEKRGARSRNIQSIFIENSQGERFSFPYPNVSGAKALAMHVSEGGTPYDSKGQAILAMCEDLSNINQFMRHIRGNKLVNENNEDVVSTVREAAMEIKNTIKSLSTQKGYNNFVAPGEKESVKEVDLSEKFMYNALETESLATAVSTVSRIIAEKEGKMSEIENSLGRVEALNGDYGFNIDKNDPEHPANAVGKAADQKGQLSSFLSYFGNKTMITNPELSGDFDVLSGAIVEPHLKPALEQRIVKIVVDMLQSKKDESVKPSATIGLAESAMLGLRKKIA